MNSRYFGAQIEMHPTKIKQNFGFLDPHEQMLEVGDEQHMEFQEGGNGPFWMTPQERISTKFSHYYELSLKDKTNS